MDKIDVLVLLVVLGVGVLIIPSRYDPQKTAQESRRRFGELTAGFV
jgi:hypothetical protein